MKKQRLIDELDNFIIECQDQELSMQTVKSYKSDINKFINFLSISEFEKRDLIRYKEQLTEKFKPKTVNRNIISLNKFIKYIEVVDKLGYFDRQVYNKYQSRMTVSTLKIQQKNSIGEVMTPSDLKRMLRKAKQLGEMDMYLIMEVFAFAGIRYGGLKYITVENINKKYIQIKTKGKILDIVLRTSLKRELKRYAKEQGIKEGTLFPGRYPGTMMSYSTIYSRLKKIAGQCRGIQLSKIHPHSFRHLFAIQYIKNGGDISRLKDILGHNDIRTTSIYTMLTLDMKKDELERINYNK